MRLRDAIALAILASIAASACSRLTFVKPNAQRGKYEQIAPEYSYQDSPGTKQRVETRDHLSRAEQRLRLNQIDQAEAEANAALKGDPASAEAHTLLGMIDERRGKSAEAGGHYAKAVELAPDQGVPLSNYGAWLCTNGRAGESLSWFDKALTDVRYQQRADALANAGACALRAGQSARVEQDLRGALALVPNHPLALETMADYQFRSGRYLDARAFSERRLAVAPATAQVLQLASQIENKLGDNAAAVRYLQRSRTEFPQMRPVLPGENTQ